MRDANRHRMHRILLLEDDADIADAVAELLSACGYEIRATASGREAVLLAAREPFVLAVLDIGVNDVCGLGAERAIADLAPIPTVVYSAEPPERWQPAAFRGGASACLRKPADLDRLADVVQALVGAPNEPPSLDATALPPDDVERLTRLGDAAIDALPFGVIELDRQGVVVAYNAYEAAAADRRAREVIGRRFVDVAPCVRVKRFVDGSADAFSSRSADRVLRFIFPCHGALAVAAVRLFFDARRDRLWLFVSRRALRPEDRVAAADAR